MGFKDYLNEKVSWATYKGPYVLGAEYEGKAYVAKGDLDFTVAYVDGAWRIQDPNGEEYEQGFKTAALAKKAAADYIEGLMESEDLSEASAKENKEKAQDALMAQRKPLLNLMMPKIQLFLKLWIKSLPELKNYSVILQVLGHAAYNDI